MIKTPRQIMDASASFEDPQTIDEALKAFDDLYKERAIVLTTPQRLAIKQSFELFNDICIGKKTERYVLPLPTGAGKTTAIVSWCVAVDKLNAKHSVSIASSQVEELFKIRGSLIKMGVSPDKIGVVYSDKQEDKKKYRLICPPTETPETCQFLLVTHKRYEQKTDKLDYRSYRGKERSIIFWDEAFRKFQCEAANITSTKKELSGILAIIEDIDFERPEDSSLLKTFLTNTLSGIGSLSPEIINIQINHDNYGASDCKKIRKALRQCKADNDFLSFCERLLKPTCELYLMDKQIASVERMISDTIKRMVILDASYYIDGLSQLDKTTQPAPIHYPRFYPNLSVQHRKCTSGKASLRKLFHDPHKRDIIIDELYNLIMTKPRDEAILIATFKGEYTDIINAQLTKRGINVDEKTDKGHSRFNFLTWGKEKGTNEFIHCQHFINVGLQDIGSDTIKALAVAETEGGFIEYPEDQDISYGDLQDFDYAQRLYQAISRIATRHPTFAGACSVNLFVHNDGYLKYLKKVFPGAVFKEGEPVFKGKEIKADTGFDLLLDIISKLPEDIDNISSTKLYQKLRDQADLTDFNVTKGVMRGIKKRLDGLSFYNPLWVYEGRGIKRTTELLDLFKVID